MPRKAEREGEEDVPGIMRRPVNARINSVDEDIGEREKERLAQAAEEAKRRLKEELLAEITPERVPVYQGVRSAGRFAVWVVRRKEASGLLLEWAASAAERAAVGVAAASSEGTPAELKEKLAALAAEELPAGWAIWALAEPSRVPGGAGFYMSGPIKPQALVFVESVDGTKNNIQHVVVDPAEIGPGVRDAVQDWIQSLRPKQSIICRPEELKLFGLGVTAGSSEGVDNGSIGGAKVSRGL